MPGTPPVRSLSSIVINGVLLILFCSICTWNLLACGCIYRNTYVCICVNKCVSRREMRAHIYYARVPFSEMQKRKQSRRAGDLENRTPNECFTTGAFGVCHVSSTNTPKVGWGKKMDFLIMESQEMAGDTEEAAFNCFQLSRSWFLSQQPAILQEVC